MIPQSHAAIVAGVVGVVAVVFGFCFGKLTERDQWIEAFKNGTLGALAARRIAQYHDRYPV